MLIFLAQTLVLLYKWHLFYTSIEYSPTLLVETDCRSLWYLLHVPEVPGRSLRFLFIATQE
jgi:hypothetical protein